MKNLPKVSGISFAILVLSVSCGGVSGGKATDEGEMDAPTTFEGPSRYSIKAYVPKKEGGLKLLELSPQNTGYARQQRNRSDRPGSSSEIFGDSGSDVRRKPNELRAHTEDGDALVDVDDPTLHDLVGWAYGACGVSWYNHHASEDADSDVGWPIEAGGHRTQPKTGRPEYFWKGKWRGGNNPGATSYENWYVATVRRKPSTATVWSHGPDDPADLLSSCDSVLALQSQLLCTAGRLVEIAESFSTVRLEQSLDGTQAILVPPQASKDRFLIRRLAMETLASFAHAGESSIGELTDYTSANPSEMQRTCGWALGYAHNTSSWSLWNSDYYQLVFDRGWLIDVSGLVPFRQFPPDFDSSVDFWAMVRPRMELHVAQYRRALELLNGLLENMGSHGLAQAETLRAEGGIAAAWGLADDGRPGSLETLPNSLRGTAAMLLGRLEVDSVPQVGGTANLIFLPGFNYVPAESPACSGAVQLKDAPFEPDIFDADGSFIRAAVADPPPKSLSQQRARAMVERAGLVLAEDEIQGGGMPAIVKKQLIIVDAYNAGILPSDPEFLEFEASKDDIYDSQIEGLSEEDFVYALRANLALYAQLSGGRHPTFPPTTIDGGAGLDDLDFLTAPQLGSIDADQRGILNATIPDPDDAAALPRFTGLSRVGMSQMGYSRFARASAAGECPTPAGTDAEIYSISAYTNASTLAARLLQGASRVTEVNTATDPEDHPEQAELEVLRTQYFAKHSIHGIAEAQIRTQGQTSEVKIHGSAEVAGMPLDELPLVVVYGDPWVAECAAGLRVMCDASVVAEATLIPTGYPAYEPGVAGGLASYTFQVVPGSTDLVTPDTQNAGHLYYLVLEPSGTSPGVVLDAFGLHTNAPTHGLSHSVRDQLDRVFSRAHALGPADKCLEANNDGIIVESCLPGIRKDQYVPLANELTSLSGGSAEDSWQHYLGLARQAATEADQLGRQIIELGITRDMRAETGAEELAGICGGAVNPAALDISAGKVSSDEDTEINECIQPDVVPAVFFQGDDVADRLPVLQEQHSCQSCSEGEDCATCDEVEALAEGLGLEAPPAAAKPPGIPGCSELMGENEGATSPLKDVVSRFGGDDGEYAQFTDGEETWFKENATRDHYRESSLAAALSKLSFREEKEKWVNPSGATATWAVYLNGSIPFLAGRFEGEDTSAAQVLELSEQDFRSGPYSGFPLCMRVSATVTTMVDGVEVQQELPEGATCSPYALRVARALGHALNMAQDAVVSPPSAAEVAELEETMRILAERSLWTMARITGSLPANKFTMFLPARDLTQHVSTDTTVPWPYVYGQSYFEPVGDRYYLTGTGFPGDRDTLGPLEPAASWLPRTGLRQVVHEGGLNPLASFLMTRASNAALLLGPMDSPDSSTESMLSAQFYDYAIGKPEVTEVNDILWDPLNDGIAPKGTNLLRDGQLYGIAVRRDCKQDESRDGNHTIQGKYGDLIPWETGDADWSAVFWRNDECSDMSRELLWDGSNVLWERPTPQVIHQSSFTTYGTCTSGAGDVSCSSGSVTWRKAQDVCGGGYKQYECRKNRREQVASIFTALVTPTIWPPSERVHTFLSAGPNFQTAVAGAGLLSCLAEGVGVARQSAAVPTISDPAQLPMLSRWIDGQAEAFALSQKEMFVENVPRKVIDYFGESGLNGSVGAGRSSDQMLAMAQSLEAVYSGFNVVYSGVRAMADSVRSAEIAMTSEELRRDQEKSRLAVQRINTIGSMVSSTLHSAAAATSGSWFNPASYASGALQSSAHLVQVVTSGRVLNELGKQDEQIDQGYDNSIDSVLQGMTEGVQRGYEQALDGMTQIRTARLDFLRAQNALVGVQDQARFAAGKASGADAVDLDGDGIEDEIPVNIVYRRENDVLKIRYQRMLESAKRYAYLARLSIEQRLGVRLESLHQEIGPLQPPTQWAEDICELSGVDYEALRSLDPVTTSQQTLTDEEAILNHFADQYVGDYINQLEEFVEYYNIEYPFHEEDDAAVLSLRDDLVYGNGMCRRQAKNLLYYSDALASRNAGDPADLKRGLSLEGWSTTPCEQEQSEPFVTEIQDENGVPFTIEAVTVSGTCLSITDDVQMLSEEDTNLLSELAEPVLAYPVDDGTSTRTEYFRSPALALGLSVLHVGDAHEGLVDISEDPGDDEGDEDGDPGESPLAAAPTNALYQTVEMRKGAYYRLSWQDQTRNVVGGLLPQRHASYRVMVTDETWTPLFLEDFSAASSSDDGWEDRIYREVFAPRDGYFHVVFVPQPSEDGLEALALSSVQLEYFEPEGPVDYEPTTGTRMVTKFDCGAGNGELFRKAFVRRCYQSECYYELTRPIQLTDNDIDSGRWDLPGIAQENYNYRHGSVALNVVGTNVLDCDGANPGCYSNGFVEYDLVHTAYNTALRDYGDEARCFNFGEGEIKRAKALATERYLGIPLSSDDEGLIGGADFSKGAFHGRPLTGVYTLRIHESPQMRWENVEDVQLVLNYRYWSRVKRDPN